MNINYDCFTLILDEIKVKMFLFLTNKDLYVYKKDMKDEWGSIRQESQLEYIYPYLKFYNKDFHHKITNNVVGSFDDFFNRIFTCKFLCSLTYRDKQFLFNGHTFNLMKSGNSSGRVMFNKLRWYNKDDQFFILELRADIVAFIYAREIGRWESYSTKEEDLKVLISQIQTQLLIFLKHI